MYIRERPLTNTPDSSFRNKITNQVNDNNLTSDNTLVVSKYTGGTHISLPNDIDIDRMTWRGEFNISQSYTVNDVVFVSPNTVYKNYNEATIEFGSTATADYTITPMALGSFVCVKNVPEGIWTSQYIESTIKPMYNGRVPYEIAQNYRSYDHNIFYPIFPTIPTTDQIEVEVFNGAASITANNTYWISLTGLSPIPMKVCAGTPRVEKTYYIMGFESGSAFLPEYLPYVAI